MLEANPAESCICEFALNHAESTGEERAQEGMRARGNHKERQRQRGTGHDLSHAAISTQN